MLVALALIGGLVLLIAGNGDEDSASKRAEEAQEQFLDRTVVDTQRGISVRIPGDWKSSKKLHVINIQSKSRCLVMALSAPVPANKANSLRREGINYLKLVHRNAKVGKVPQAEIGGVPTTTNVIRFRNKQGTQVRVLLSVGKGQKNAYLTQVVLGNPTCQADLALGQVVLSSVEYTK